MKAISLRLDEKIFQETEDILAELKQARNRYINEAVAHFNKLQRRKLLEEQFALEAKLAWESSAEVLQEFETIGDEYDYNDAYTQHEA